MKINVLDWKINTQYINICQFAHCKQVTRPHTCSVYLVSEEGGLFYRLVPCIQKHDSQQFHTGVNKARQFVFYFICGIQRESWVQSPLVTRIV